MEIDMLKRIQGAARSAGAAHDYKGIEFNYLNAICRVLHEEKAEDIRPFEVVQRFGTYATDLVQKYS